MQRVNLVPRIFFMGAVHFLMPWTLGLMHTCQGWRSQMPNKRQEDLLCSASQSCTLSKMATVNAKSVVGTLEFTV
jgi:hypothetical protein